MNEKLSDADQAFYEWYHLNGLNQNKPIEWMREAFLAGWNAGPGHE